MAFEMADYTFDAHNAFWLILAFWMTSFHEEASSIVPGSFLLTDKIIP